MLNREYTTRHEPTVDVLFLVWTASVLKPQPNSITMLYNSPGRTCICNILWLIRCVNGFLKFYDTEMFKSDGALLVWPCQWKENVLHEISFYMLFLNHVCSEALWPGGSDRCSTPARLWWRVRLLLLNISTAPPPASRLRGSKKKPFIPAQNQPGQPAAQCISHISGVCVCGCVFCTLPLWELELCPSSILTHCTGPISTGTLSEQTSRLSHGEHGASL